MTVVPLHDTTTSEVPVDLVEVLSADDIRHMVALHVAATLLPPTVGMAVREQVRANWFSALKAITDNLGPHWALAYVPGTHHGDNDVYAVHRPTGAVFGGDEITNIKRGESTDQWLARLTAHTATLT